MKLNERRLRRLIRALLLENVNPEEVTKSSEDIAGVSTYDVSGILSGRVTDNLAGGTTAFGQAFEDISAVALKKEGIVASVADLNPGNAASSDANAAFADLIFNAPPGFKAGTPLTKTALNDCVLVSAKSVGGPGEFKGSGEPKKLVSLLLSSLTPLDITSAMPSGCIRLKAGALYIALDAASTMSKGRLVYDVQVAVPNNFNIAIVPESAVGNTQVAVDIASNDFKQELKEAFSKTYSARTILPSQLSIRRLLKAASKSPSPVASSFNQEKSSRKIAIKRALSWWEPSGKPFENLSEPLPEGPSGALQGANIDFWQRSILSDADPSSIYEEYVNSITQTCRTQFNSVRDACNNYLDVAGVNDAASLYMLINRYLVLRDEYMSAQAIIRPSLGFGALKDELISMTEQSEYEPSTKSRVKLRDALVNIQDDVFETAAVDNDRLFLEFKNSVSAKYPISDMFYLNGNQQDVADYYVKSISKQNEYSNLSDPSALKAPVALSVEGINLQPGMMASEILKGKPSVFTISDETDDASSPVFLSDVTRSKSTGFSTFLSLFMQPGMYTYSFIKYVIAGATDTELGANLDSVAKVAMLSQVVNLLKPIGSYNPRRQYTDDPARAPQTFTKQELINASSEVDNQIQATMKAITDAATPQLSNADIATLTGLLQVFTKLLQIPGINQQALEGIALKVRDAINRTILKPLSERNTYSSRMRFQGDDTALKLFEPSLGPALITIMLKEALRVAQGDSDLLIDAIYAGSQVIIEEVFKDAPEVTKAPAQTASAAYEKPIAAESVLYESIVKDILRYTM